MKLKERETTSVAGLWTLFLSIVGYRVPMPVMELMVFRSNHGTTGYYVCPRCKVTLDREFMSFCDRCGQHLDWHGYRNAKIVYPGRHNTST